MDVWDHVTWRDNPSLSGKLWVYSRFIYIHVYIYMCVYMYIGFPLSIINVVLINVVITHYILKNEADHQWALKKLAEPIRKDLKSQTNCGHVPGDNQG